jgi:GNAT superfamily N-acetyltransferase
VGAPDPSDATELAVRRATPDDLAFVAQDGYLPEAVVRRKVEDGDVWVARRGVEPVGYLRLEWLWSAVPYVALVRVLAPHRRRGVGRALLAAAEAEAARRGQPALYSSSQADEPEPQAWHRHVGFEECGLISGLNEGGVGEVFFRRAVGGSSP